MWILLLHYSFFGKPNERKGNAKDVEALKNLFGKYKDCRTKEMASPTMAIDKILSDDNIISLFGDKDKSILYK